MRAGPGGYGLRASRLISIWVALACCVPALGSAAASSSDCDAQGPPEAPARQYCELLQQGARANLDGNYDEADLIWERLRELDPNSPTPEIWIAETAWWRLIVDQGAAGQDARIEEATERAIELADVQLKKNGADPRALEHKGMALIIRARHQGMRGRYLRAGRAGEEGRALLEEALLLDPNLQQGKFPLGLYYYYTGIAPNFLKWVSWLWFVPKKGDRTKGIEMMRQVRDGTGLRSDEARFMLMIINTYHSPMDLESAIASARLLHSRYPDNVLIQSEMVEALLKGGQYDEAIEVALDLEKREPAGAEARVRPMLGRILRAQAILLKGNSDQAWLLLESINEQTALLPVWGGAWLHLVRGQVLDAQGDRKAALAEYKKVTGLKGLAFNRRAALIAEAATEQPFSPASYRELPMVQAGPP